jgi:hypothetical protein
MKFNVYVGSFNFCLDCYLCTNPFFQTVLVGLKYEELSWEYARPSQEDSPDCLPCLFLQFMVVENGARVSKILQVFSKQVGNLISLLYFCLYRKQFQAIMMDALIVTFVDRLKQKAAEDAEKGTFDAATDTDGLSKNANQLVSY